MDAQERQREETKRMYLHIMRAKLYGVIAINTLEGITSEVDNLLPYELEKDNVDALSDQYRKYHNGILYPTSYGDHMDRAIKSLSKDLGIAVSVELVNTQAVKRVLMKHIRNTSEEERQAVADWLVMQNESIMKSVRFNELIDKCCMYFYKKPSSEVSDDNLSFIRRSANELLRNKASKEALRKKLLSGECRYEDEDDVDVALSVYGLHGGLPDTHLVMDQVLPSAGTVSMADIGSMATIPTMGNMLGMNSMPIPYEGVPVMQHMGQMTNAVPAAMISGREVENQQRMSLPMNSMSMNIPQINLNNMASIPVNSINQMPLPVGVNMGVNVMEGPRGYTPVNGNVEMTIARPVNEEGEERPNPS
ncbi:hypothetical protein JH06_2155 [Blastocystis sp. subtype 4]|uniref:hypothetical protein n=1 Tax=Blastocystis sp. subtype 4 TaxID=944170 RepID=UPI00071192E9|nr:hypothetical protein JH06_2155 [Blastocystis sp. subtype 4]KNB44925.1 hypothetical protein JH06_2155 [Blastocystis sp. subtype 4]|eukprot:XP_014528368.1 hypothetical protein JH06_2155 [Blastocystis sp. subtype 4]